MESELFDPAECFYVPAGSGAVCRPGLVFRRVMLNNHQPDALVFRDLLVTSELTNRTSRVHFTKYNEMGYQFTVATRRNYWLHWDTPMELNPSRVYLHKIDYLNSTHGWLALSLKWPQVRTWQGVLLQRETLRLCIHLSALVLSCVYIKVFTDPSYLDGQTEYITLDGPATYPYM